MKKFTTLKKTLLVTAVAAIGLSAQAQEWSNVAIPADAGSGKTWELQSNVSDDFSYTKSFNSGGYSTRSNFGASNQWNNFYHNQWDGPGYSYWDNENVSVDGDNLAITVGYTTKNSKGGTYGVSSGCVTSNNKVVYPVYVEASLSVANISLASCFWLLSPDDTEEIDIIENYGGVDWFKNYTHISSHSFIRNPFTDYQPRDKNSWYPIAKVTDAGGWGPYCWNSGNRRYVRMGVNWVSPKHFEYYIDGELVRVMYYNAIATYIDGAWQYTYYNSVTQNANGNSMPTNGGDGYSLITTHATSTNYDFSKLQATSNASNGYNVIDTGWFQGGDDNDLDDNGITNEARGFTKEMDIIINMESQSWLTGSTPSATDLADGSKNQMLVDWVRVYKPVASDNGSTTPVLLTVEAESFSTTGGTFSDGSPAGSGFNATATTVNYVNKDDWADYNVNIPTAGEYKIAYSISTPSTGSTVTISVGGVSQNTTSVPNNRAWDSYTTLNGSATFNLEAGNNIIRLTAGGTNWAWNLDKFTLERVGSKKSALLETPAQELVIFPNPAVDRVSVKGLNEGTYTLRILNLQGQMVTSKVINTNNQADLNVSDLQKGIYLLNIQGAGVNKTLKLQKVQ